MMESSDKDIAYTPVPIPNKSANTSSMQTIVEITQYYQEKTQDYAHVIQCYNLEIEKLKVGIDKALKDKKEDEDSFSKQV